MGCTGSAGFRATDYDDFASGLNKMAVKRSGCPHWRVLFLNGKSKFPYPGVILQRIEMRGILHMRDNARRRLFVDSQTREFRREEADYRAGWS